MTTPSEVVAVALDHARRGVRLQVVLRFALVAFTALTVVLVPPATHATACALLVGAYTVWALAVALWTWRGHDAAVRYAWLALLVDGAVLAALTLLTGVSAPQSWTSDVFTTAFLLVPVLAATQLRPWVCAAVVVPTTLAYLAAAVATQEANAEPWSSLLLRTLVMAAVGAGCVGLSRIQRSRVTTIGELVRVRTALLGELADVEVRERRMLSEHLHDGALQYVLAARLDLDDARADLDPPTFERLEHALAETSRLLRSTVAELHPSVLEKAGLPAALRDLAGRCRCPATVEAPDWTATGADALLLRTARELLGNADRHARASAITVTLTREGGRARLAVTDDGIGPPDGDAPAGHIGLASHRVRVEAARGRLWLEPHAPRGTRATVELPA